MYCRNRSGGYGNALSRTGFSLIEIMIVVVIMGILAAAVAVGVRGKIDTAKRNKARTDIATLSSEVNSFYLDKGRFPTNDEGLGVLPGTRVPKDPWGKGYIYVSPGRKGDFEIRSLGADGRTSDDDLTSDDLDAPSNNSADPQRSASVAN
jgi:general secretion pathway protein G